jgi:creatinine amidohydrolase
VPSKTFTVFEWQVYIQSGLIKRFRGGGRQALKNLLCEMSWAEAKEYFSNNDIVIVPVGATEQHGPANPLGTDFLLAEAIAKETSKRTGVLCFPSIPFGVSTPHKQFWGTIFISSGTFKAYVKEVCLSLYYYGVRKIVIVNGHGGNLRVLMELARELREDGIFVSVFQWWPAAIKLLPELFSLEERGHAGAEETSVNLFLHAALVNMGRAVDSDPVVHELQVEGLTLPLSTLDETVSGVYGKQTSASADRGKRVFEAVVDELAKHVRLLKKAKIEDLAPKPKV